MHGKREAEAIDIGDGKEAVVWRGTSKDRVRGTGGAGSVLIGVYNSVGAVIVG